MPEGSKVDKTYQALRREGESPGKAARIAQAKTGQALATGKAPEHKRTSHGLGLINRSG